jgi:hypothetical protein
LQLTQSPFIFSTLSDLLSTTFSFAISHTSDFSSLCLIFVSYPLPVRKSQLSNIRSYIPFIGCHLRQNVAHVSLS